MPTWSSKLHSKLQSDAVRPQQGVQRQTSRVLSVLEDTERLKVWVPQQLLGLAIPNLGWPAQVALPLLHVDELVTTFRKIEFGAPLANEVPSLGVPRLIERSQTTHTVHSARYGLALKFENGRMTTPEGAEDFRLGLLQMAQIIRQNVAHEIITALINPDPEEKAYQRLFGVHDFTTMMEAAYRERDQFACVNKSMLGMHRILNEMTLQIQTQAGVTPNMLILGRTHQTYLRLENPLTTVYMLAGPKGPVQLNAEPSLGTLMGLQVYEPPVYRAKFDAAAGPSALDSPAAVQVRDGAPQHHGVRRVGPRRVRQDSH